MSVTVKNFDSPDESRTPDKTKVDILELGSVKLGRMTAQPGWSWSECIKPVVGGDSCQVHHIGMVSAGRMHIVPEGGAETDIGPGDVYEIQPGHTASILGDETFVAYEFSASAVETYARSS